MLGQLRRDKITLFMTILHNIKIYVKKVQPCNKTLQCVLVTWFQKFQQNSLNLLVTVEQ